MLQPGLHAFSSACHLHASPRLALSSPTSRMSLSQDEVSSSASGSSVVASIHASICAGRSVVQWNPSSNGSISPHGLGQPKHMKKTASSLPPDLLAPRPSCWSVPASTGSTSSISCGTRDQRGGGVRPARVVRGSQPSSSCLERSDASWSGGYCRQL